MASIRITESTIREMIKHINSLEFHVNPDDSKSVIGGELWRVDIVSGGVYINRKHANPTHTDDRLKMKEAWLFLTGVYYVLYRARLKQQDLV